jgi:hypothetical protein
VEGDQPRLGLVAPELVARHGESGEAEKGERQRRREPALVSVSVGDLPS